MTLPTIEQIVIALAILVAAWIVSSIVLFVVRRSKKILARTETTFDDTLVKLLGRPLHLGFQLIGVVIALWYLFPHLSYQEYGYGDLTVILLIAWLAYTMNRLVRGLMDWKAQEADRESPDGIKRGAFGFLNTIVTLLVWGLGLAFVLNQLGVDISALLAGLGIAGIAVALALQNTLSSIFSAVGLAIDRPIRQGDFVRLEDGTEGFVEDISMRSTRIRTFQHSLVIVPNDRITNMVIENSYLPKEDISLKISLGVGYGANLEKAENIAIDTASTILEQHQAMGETEPFVRFSSFGDSAIQMNVFLSVDRFLDQYIIKHEFIKALTAAYKKAKIDIPYPQVEVHMSK
jgi:small-conductance mechanosensitive channel